MRISIDPLRDSHPSSRCAAVAPSVRRAASRLARIGLPAITLLVATLAAQPEVARISGSIAYPSEEVPAMQVVARARADGALTIVRTIRGQRRYDMPLSAGTYVVFAVPIAADGDPNIRGAYTTYSICARDVAKRNAGQCATGALVDVTVGPAGAVRNVDIDDWYMPAELSATLVVDGAEDDAEVAFSSYPSTVAAPKTPAAPDFASAPRGTRRYEASIRHGASAGARFAGRVAVARWGCGASCERWALVDLRSGRIVMPGAPFQPLRSTFPCVVQPVEYRIDSRLLRVHRLDDARVITQHFLWSESSSRLVPLSEGVMPVAQFCRSRR